MQKTYELDNITEVEKNKLFYYFNSFDDEQRIKAIEKMEKILNNDAPRKPKIKRKKANPKYQALLLKKNYIFELRDKGKSLRDIEKIITAKMRYEICHTYIAKFLKKEA